MNTIFRIFVSPSGYSCEYHVKDSRTIIRILIEFPYLGFHYYLQYLLVSAILRTSYRYQDFNFSCIFRTSVIIFRLFM